MDGIFVMVREDPTLNHHGIKSDSGTELVQRYESITGYE